MFLPENMGATQPKFTWVIGFFARNAFFTAAEFAQEYATHRDRSTSAHAMLSYYVRSGHLVRVTRGVYASAGTSWSELLLASKLGHAPIFAYRSALTVHGAAEIAYACVTITARKTRPVFFNEVSYRTVRSPIADPLAHTVVVDGFKVTTAARTLVDCFDRPDLCGDFLDRCEVFCASDDFEPLVDLDEVVHYATLLRHPVTAARVGACLWAHPRWGLWLGHHAELARLGSGQTMYADPTVPRDETEYLGRFRLRVPSGFKARVNELRLARKRA